MTPLSDAVTAALAAEFPVVTPFARVTLTEAHQTGDALRANVQVVLIEDGEIVDVVEQESYVCRPTPAAVAEAAAIVRTRVGRPLAAMFAGRPRVEPRRAVPSGAGWPERARHRG